MPHVLTYDTLPPHSRLRRELADGVLRITAAAEEPGPLVRRAALRRAALPAALICCATLVVGLAVFGATFQVHRRTMSTWTLAVLVVAFVVFCAALFAFVWRIHYTTRIEAARQALQQGTVLAASPQRLIIETSGPLGAASHDLGNSERPAPTIRCFRHGRLDVPPLVDCLEIVLSDGTMIRLLPGRDQTELRWVARALASAMKV